MQSVEGSEQKYLEDSCTRNPNKMKVNENYLLNSFNLFVLPFFPMLEQARNKNKCYGDALLMKNVWGENQRRNLECIYKRTIETRQ